MKRIIRFVSDPPLGDNTLCMPSSRRTAVIGAFKGMGDLLAGVPVVLEELCLGSDVHLLLWPSAALLEFARQIDYCGCEDRIHFHTLPRGSLSSLAAFLRQMRALRASMVWISPHAPRRDSSWKISLLMRLMRILFWHRAELVGADSERMAALFDLRLPVDRNLPLRKREWSAYCLYREWGQERTAPTVRFLPSIHAPAAREPLYDLLIHPGATAANRRWPFAKYAELIPMLPTEWRIACVALPDDLDEMKRLLPPERPVSYLCGSIGDSIAALASTRLLLAMDSGNMHFAALLGVPTVVVFGYTNPSNIIEQGSCVEAVYEPSLPCQPCMKATCSQPEIYCLLRVEARTVADRLLRRWRMLKQENDANRKKLAEVQEKA